MQYDLHNKTVIITGGAGGLGRALTSKLLTLGANVALLDMTQLNFTDHFAKDAALQGKAAQLLSLKVDITQQGELNLALNQVINTFSRLDVLINNAGITHLSQFSDTQENLFEKIMAVNFTASVNLTRICLPYLQQSQGQIMAISSVAGFAPLYGRTAYAASKHAMEGFFTSLATEVADNNIHVAIVAPSFVKSRPELTAQANQGAASPGAMKKSTNGEQLSPEFAAAKIIQTLQKKQPYLRLGKVSKVAYWLNTLLPNLYRSVMTKSAKKEFMS